MKFKQLKRFSVLLIAGISLTACVGGIYDEDIIDKRDQELPVFGITAIANQTVEIYCSNKSETLKVATTRSSNQAYKNAEGHFGYFYSKNVSVPNECWKIDQNLAVEQESTRHFQTNLVVKIDGVVAKTMTKETFDNCIVPNLDSVDKMSKCSFEENIELLAKRKLLFRVAQLAKSSYLDGVKSSPDEQKENRANWLSANGFSELGYWFGKDRYRLTPFSSLWEVSLAKSDSGKHAVVAFAGSEPPEIQTVDGNEVINWGDISDWRFDTWVDLMPADESDYATSSGHLESLCEQFQCSLHSGFLTYASNFWKYASEANGLLEKLRELKVQGVQQVYFTGHSLGGAVATVFASFYEAERMYDESLPELSAVTTFAAPMVGDNNFKSLYNHLNLESKTIHYVTPGDPGARFPRDLHLCEALDSVSLRTACWAFAVGGIQAKSRWMAVKDRYVPVGSEIIFSRLGNDVLMEPGYSEPWDSIDINMHFMSNYIQLISDCETSESCWK